MKWHRVLSYVLIPSLGFAQSASFQSPTVNSGGKIQWFSTEILKSDSQPTHSQSSLLIARDALQEALEKRGDENPQSLKEMNLPGTAEEQKQAVLMTLEAAAGRSSSQFEKFSDWARKQGIRHPQENQLKKIIGQIEGQPFENKLSMIQNLPSGIRSGVASGLVENEVLMGSQEGLRKLIEQKSSYSPMHYSKLLTLALWDISALYENSYDLPLIEKVIREAQSAEGADASLICRNLWNALLQYDQAPERGDEDWHPNKSPDSKRLRLTLLKPLVKIQKSKINCPDVGNVDEMAQWMAKEGYLGQEDLRELNRHASSKTDLEKPSSVVLHGKNACGLSEIQSDIKNHLLDMDRQKTKSPGYFVSTTQQKCNFQMVTQKNSSGIQTKFSLWTQEGQKILDFKQTFKNGSEILQFLLAGKFPTPAASKVPVLTNLPQIQSSANQAVK